MRALTVGGAMIDTIAIIESNRIEHMRMRNADTSFLLLEEGRKTEALEISTHCGGGAVNAAIALARLGSDVSTILKLGVDNRADLILARLSDEGVSTRWVVQDPRAPTGASTLVSSHDRNAAIFTFRGANSLLEPADIHDDAFDVDMIYISSLSNASADRFPDLVARAKARGALVVANPGVRQLSARSGAFRKALGNIDVLALNRSEADVLVPSLSHLVDHEMGAPRVTFDDGIEMPPLLLRGLASGGHELDLITFFEVLIGLGPRYVVITDGAAGAFVGTRNEIIYCPGVPTKVMGTAGAGDAFASTFASRIAMGETPADALRAATLNAASVLAHVDTQTGLLDRAALEAQLAERVGELDVRRWPLATP